MYVYTYAYIYIYTCIHTSVLLVHLDQRFMTCDDQELNLDQEEKTSGGSADDQPSRCSLVRICPMFVADQ